MSKVIALAYALFGIPSLFVVYMYAPTMPPLRAWTVEDAWFYSVFLGSAAANGVACLVFRIRNRVNIGHGTLPGGSRGQSRAPDHAQ
jgi:hypothetical protein